MSVESPIKSFPPIGVQMGIGRSPQIQSIDVPATGAAVSVTLANRTTIIRFRVDSLSAADVEYSYDENGPWMPIAAGEMIKISPVDYDGPIYFHVTGSTKRTVILETWV